MLFNRRSDMISELEAEIKALRQKLRDAEATIEAQKLKIDEFYNDTSDKSKNSYRSGKSLTKAALVDYSNSDISIDTVSELLYNYVCEDKKARLDQNINPLSILDKKTHQNIDQDLVEIISKSGEKGALVAYWRRKQNNPEATPCFDDLLPIFFNLLSKHWWVASQGAEKDSFAKVANLKYNANAYVLLYKEIIPQLVIDAKNKEKEKEQRRITKIQKKEIEKQKRHLELNEAAVNAKRLVDKYGDKFLVECWIGLGGGTNNPPSASKYISALVKELSKNHDFDAAKIKDIKTIMYLCEEILPPLALSRLQAGEQERKRLAEKLLRKQKRDAQNEIKEDWPLYVEQLDEALQLHSVAFLRNMRAAYQKNEYGAVVKDERTLEIERFLRSLKLLSRANKHGLQKTIQYVNRWYAQKKRIFDQSDAVPENGHDFEHWVAAKLNDAGWMASVTQASGDDGVDVIAVHDDVSVAVQCKRFRGSVGNKAVQEVYSGMKHMQLDRAVVISTGQYTKAAQNLASTTGVLLLSEHDIPHMWDLLNT